MPSKIQYLNNGEEIDREAALQHVRTAAFWQGAEPGEMDDIFEAAEAPDGDEFRDELLDFGIEVIIHS